MKQSKTKNIIVWCFDSYKIIRKLAFLNSYLESCGYKIVWICNSYKTYNYLIACGIKAECAQEWIDRKRVSFEKCDGPDFQSKINELIKFDKSIDKRISKLDAELDYFERQAIFYYNFFRKLFKKYKFDFAYNLNGFTTPSKVLDYVAENSKTNILYWENGIIPNSLIFDRIGVNAGMSFKFNNTIEPELQKKNIKELLKTIRESNSTIYGDNIKYKPVGLYEHFKLKDSCKVVLVPLQIDTDTNVVEYSNFSNMEEFLELLARYLGEKYNIFVVIKEHPKRKISGKKLEFKFPSNFRYVDDLMIPQMINDIDCVLTINSTVGFEALINRIPVITFGESLYNNLGFTTQFNNQDLDKLILKLSWDKSHENIFIKFFQYLVENHIFICDKYGSPPNVLPKPIQNIISRNIRKLRFTRDRDLMHIFNEVKDFSTIRYKFLKF